jgi:predicted nuclease with TOPRIM domain
MLIIIASTLFLVTAGFLYVGRKHEAFRKEVKRAELDLAEFRIGVNERMQKIQAEEARLNKDIRILEDEINVIRERIQARGNV